MPRLGSQLKKFLKEALHRETYSNLSPLPDGVSFRLQCLQKTNQHFTMESEKIFKDWEELKGREYDWHRSKERFLNALKGSCYFTVTQEKEDSSFICKFNNRDEIAKKRAEKKQQAVEGGGKCQSSGDSPQKSTIAPPKRAKSTKSTARKKQQTVGGGGKCESRADSPQTSPIASLWSTSPPGIMQPKQEGSRSSDRSRNLSSTCVAGEFPKKPPETLLYTLTNIFNTTPCKLQGILCSAATKNAMSAGIENIILTPQLISVAVDGSSNYVNKSVAIQNTSFPNNMEVGPGFDTSVFANTSGDVFNADLVGKTIPPHHLIPADVTTVCNSLSNSVDVQNSILSQNSAKVDPNNCPVFSMMKESCSHQMDLLRPAPSNKSNTPPRSTTSPELQAKWSNLNSNSTENPGGGMCSDIYAMKEVLNTSMDTEDRFADSSDCVSITLAHESSPLDASIGHENSNTSLDYMNTQLFPENLEPVPEKVTVSESSVPLVGPSYNTGGGEYDLCVSHSPDIEGINQSQSIELLPNEGTSGNEKYEDEPTPNNPQFSEGLGGDGMDVDERELADDMINEVVVSETDGQLFKDLINSVYDEVFPLSSVNQVLSEALGVPPVKNRKEETVGGGSIGNVASGQSSQPQQFLISVKSEVLMKMKSILEMISCIPGVSCASVAFPVQTASSSNSGDPSHSVVLGNFHSLGSASNREVAVHCNPSLQFLKSPDDLVLNSNGALLPLLQTSKSQPDSLNKIQH